MLRSAGGIRPKRPLRSRAGRRPGRGPARNGVGILGPSARDRVGPAQGPGGGIRHDPRGDGARNQVGCPGASARDQVGKTAAGWGRGARDRVGTPGPAARDQVGPSERRCTKRSRDLPGAGVRTDRQVPRPPPGAPAGRRRPSPPGPGPGPPGAWEGKGADRPLLPVKHLRFTNTAGDARDVPRSAFRRGFGGFGPSGCAPGRTGSPSAREGEGPGYAARGYA